MHSCKTCKQKKKTQAHKHRIKKKEKDNQKGINGQVELIGYIHAKHTNTKLKDNYKHKDSGCSVEVGRGALRLFQNFEDWEYLEAMWFRGSFFSVKGSVFCFYFVKFKKNF